MSQLLLVLADVLITSTSVDAAVVFWEPEVDVGDLAPFQILLSSHPDVSLSSIPFTSLAIHLNGDVPPVVVRHAGGDNDADIPAVQRIDLGELVVSPASSETKEVEGSLRWGAGTTIVLAGSVSSSLPMNISVSQVKFLAVHV